jgi:hypothetical protein
VNLAHALNVFSTALNPRQKPEQTSRFTNKLLPGYNTDLLSSLPWLNEHFNSELPVSLSQIIVVFKFSLNFGVKIVVADLRTSVAILQYKVGRH